VASETHHELASVRIEATLADYDRLLSWARQWPNRRWAVENAAGLGYHLVSWLLARGEHVVDVPPRSTARVRQLSRGGRRKNDRIDAAAAACVAALAGDANPVQPDGPAEALALLDERRTNLSQTRVRTANQLHALLRALLPGGAPRDLSATRAEGLIATVHPCGQVDCIRTQLATDLVADLRALDARLRANATDMAKLVAQSGSTLTTIPGIGAVTAARLIGRTGRASRFPSAAAFANYAGVAPIEIASADRTRHRLSRCGDRQLNSALHTLAITQVRMPGTRGHSYYNSKIAEGKTPREAQRCLKRRLADHIWRTMISDDRNRPRGRAREHTGATLPSGAAGPTPMANSSDQSQPRPADDEPTTAPAPAP
jgi:transposase